MSIGSKAVFWAEDGMAVTNGTDAGTQLLGVPVWPGDDNNYSEVSGPAPGSPLLRWAHLRRGMEHLRTLNLAHLDGTTAGTYPVTATYPHGLVDDLDDRPSQSLYFVNALGKGAELYRFVP